MIWNSIWSITQANWTAFWYTLAKLWRSMQLWKELSRNMLVIKKSAIRNTFEIDWNCQIGLEVLVTEVDNEKCPIDPQVWTIFWQNYIYQKHLVVRFAGFWRMTALDLLLWTEGKMFWGLKRMDRMLPTSASGPNRICQKIVRDSRILLENFLHTKLYMFYETLFL